MLTRKMAISAALIGITVFAFASMGGGRNKAKTKLTAGYTPIRTSQGFTLRSGPTYRGSVILSQERNKSAITYNSFVTYESGNTTYILPNRYKLPTVSGCQGQMKSNLQLLNLKLRLRK